VTRTRSLAVATWALFVGLALVIAGVGLFGTVIGIRSEQNGYANWVIGVIGAAYYAGFLLGSRITLSAMTNVGHIRVFAAFSSLLGATMIMAGLNDSAPTWIVARLLTGVFSAGLYVVAESWLNGLASNETRGRLLAIYLVVTGGSYGVGQLMVGTVGTQKLTAFAVAAMLAGASVAPIALSEAAQAPAPDTQTKLSLRRLAEMAPTGMGAGVLVGLTHGAFLTMAVVYATREGLTAAGAGRFAAVTAVGGVVLQWPLSAASDQLDRRYVGAVTSIAAMGGCFYLLVAGPDGWHGLAAMAIIGGLSLPLYSIAAAYMSDWVEPEYMSAASSQMVMLYGVGALAGPMVVGIGMNSMGADAYPWTLLVMHGLIAVFLIYRLFAWREPLAKTPFSDATLSARAFFIPANVVWMGRHQLRRTRRRIHRHRS